jgi:hypothetical protein
MLEINAVQPSLVKDSTNLYQQGGLKYIIPYPCTDKSHCSLISVKFPRGIYKIECWGASGGDRYTEANDGGEGAYTSGEISFATDKTLFLSIGATAHQTINGTYGGGGLTIRSRSRSGGGATDVRTENNESFEGLKSRIMVAAGGGGGVNHGTLGKGGYGGNLTGGVGNLTNSTGCSGPGSFTYAKPANQTHGGISAIGNGYLKGIDGEFGKGGYVHMGYPGTGGGGYYGGGAGVDVSCIVLTGSGGSSFISGHEGCDAIDSSSTENNIIHTGQSVHFSHYKFRHTEMRSGAEEIPAPLLYPSNLTIGRKGDGCVRITVILSNAMIKTFRYSRYGMRFFIYITLVLS